ncbi:MAG TPA: carboxypeptidase regulatory-like domain-containing protein, partial [Bryobacteraceae bacterium]|nr:carboxypeptidase regulatory-like domain-containing protein [Bryobacteraceae bacterium]
MMKNRARLPILVALCTALLPGQSNFASITGILTDGTGAAVPNGEVVITSQDTAIVTRVRSNDSGIYTAASLLAGNYGIDVQATGFKTRRIPALTLETNQRLRLDFTLDVGDVKESVEVQATIVPLQQESAEISDTISSTEIRNMPLNGRSPYSLLALSAGISGGGDDPSNLSYDDRVSINGSRARGNAFVIDGAATTHIGGIPERIGSIEAIHEFKVLGSTYSAEYGRTSGGVVTFQVKSGTQNYHGVLYEYHRNRALNAANWENNARGIRQPNLIRNEFGGTFGGPVPGTQKRMFFFASYEGLRDRIPVTRTRTIPDAALRTGDFSRIPVVINDPLTGQPFPNNVIPGSRLDPAAAKFLQLFPEPNNSGVFVPRFGISTENYVRPTPTSDYKNYGIARWDYNATDHDKLFATFSHVNDGPRTLGNDFETVLNTQIGPRFRNIRRLTVGYTRVIRPTITTEFLAFAQRDPRKIEPFFPEFDVTRELGIQRRAWTTLPIISMSGGFGSYGNSQIQDWLHQPAGLSSITTSVRGRHNLRFGAQLYQNQFKYISANNISGTYNFNGEITGGIAGRENPINSLADLLLGAVKTASVPVPQIPVARMNYNFGTFLQDDWKVSSKLTLNLGLRYEFETWQIAKNNVYSRVDLATGQLLVAGQNATRNLNLQNDWLNLSPRFGVAYSMNPRTVLRSGFAIFHNQRWVDNGELVSYPGWTGTQNWVDLGLGRAQPFTFTEGFPVETVPTVTEPLALAAAATVGNPLPVGAVTYNPTDKLPYTLQWNFGVQRDIGFNTVAELSYVASRSLFLARTLPINQPQINRAGEAVVNRVPVQQLRPYPRYAGFNAVFYDGTASYHSFQAKATRRFGQGLSADFNYTFSKNIDNASGFNENYQIPWQFMDIEKSLSNLDRPHVFSLGWVYELPFGRGKPLLSGNRFASALLGGFVVNGLVSASSGLPFTITQATTNLILATQRPDVIDPTRLDGRVPEPFFVGPARRYLIAPGDPAFPF